MCDVINVFLICYLVWVIVSYVVKWENLMFEDIGFC